MNDVGGPLLLSQQQLWPSHDVGSAERYNRKAAPKPPASDVDGHLLSSQQQLWPGDDVEVRRRSAASGGWCP
jgi:hypothetical protein